MRPDSRTVDQDLGRRPAGRGQGMENLDPNALFSPSHEPIVERLVRAIIIGRINPTAAGFQNVHNAADDAPVVNTRLAARIGWQKRLKPAKNCSSVSQK